MTGNISEIYLDHGFSYKDKVKALGCKWRPNKKAWACPLNNSVNNIKSLMELKNVYFVKEYVSDWKAEERNDCFKRDYRLCYHIVEYNEDEILELYRIFNNKPKTELELNNNISFIEL